MTRAECGYDRGMLAEVDRLRWDLLLLEETLSQYEVAPNLSYADRVARILGKLRTVEGELRTLRALAGDMSRRTASDGSEQGEPRSTPHKGREAE